MDDDLPVPPVGGAVLGRGLLDDPVPRPQGSGLPWLDLADDVGISRTAPLDSHPTGVDGVSKLPLIDGSDLGALVEVTIKLNTGGDHNPRELKRPVLRTAHVFRLGQRDPFRGRSKLDARRRPASRNGAGDEDRCG